MESQLSVEELIITRNYSNFSSASGGRRLTEQWLALLLQCCRPITEGLTIAGPVQLHSYSAAAVATLCSCAYHYSSSCVKCKSFIKCCLLAGAKSALVRNRTVRCSAPRGQLTPAVVNCGKNCLCASLQSPVCCGGRSRAGPRTHANVLLTTRVESAGLARAVQHS